MAGYSNRSEGRVDHFDRWLDAVHDSEHSKLNQTGGNRNFGPLLFGVALWIGTLSQIAIAPTVEEPRDIKQDEIAIAPTVEEPRDINQDEFANLTPAEQLELIKSDAETFITPYKEALRHGRKTKEN